MIEVVVAVATAVLTVYGAASPLMDDTDPWVVTITPMYYVWACIITSGVRWLRVNFANPGSRNW